jgi:hypothetical protein
MRAILGFVTLLFLVGWIAVADGTDSAFAGLKKKKKKKQVRRKHTSFEGVFDTSFA